ncbi:MAG: zinc-dependent metalloprotease, partial [Pyrinomonadaceae bacterium]
EILKGDVTLDSQRARQDFLLGTGMSPQYKSGSVACDFGLMPDVDYLAADNSAPEVTAMAYARIRQLSAHEVGHTLGFAHNFAASTYGRGSVMDYPAPMVEIKNGKLDLSNAYAVGIGPFDKFAVRYSYEQFAPTANENAELQKIVNEGIANGMLFISDGDTRPANAANPLSNLWDNGSDPVAMLKHEMQVRRIGLNEFSIENIPTGAPMSELENKFLPLYLHHRYQLTAAIKSLGGVYYTYAVREGGSPRPSRVTENVSPDTQRKALEVILETIRASELTIPENTLKMMPPTAYGYGSGRSELFAKRTSPVFDPVGAAEIAADMTISGLLEPSRAARMVVQNSRNKLSPHFREVVDALMRVTWRAPISADTEQAIIQRAVQSLVVGRLMDLAANERAQAQVRAVATESLRSLMATLRRTPATGETAAHYRVTVDDIDRFLTRPDAPRKQSTPLTTPPGDPIGN